MSVSTMTRQACNSLLLYAMNGMISNPHLVGSIVVCNVSDSKGTRELTVGFRCLEDAQDFLEVLNLEVKG